jgi:hypothetical protein
MLNKRQVLKNSFIVGLILLVTICQGQSTAIGGGLTLPTYWGDLNGVSFLKSIKTSTNFGVSIGLLYPVSNSLTLEPSLSIGKFQGADSLSANQSTRTRNLSFYSRIINAQLKAMYHPFEITISEMAYAPFVSAGFNVFNFDPKTQYKGLEYRLQPLGTEGQGMPGFAPKYKLYSYGFSGGGGLKVRINDNSTLVIQSEAVITNTDYIDDVGRSYVNFFELSSGNGLLAATLADRTGELTGSDQPTIRPTGTQRGGSAKDLFFLTSVRFYYTIGEPNNGIRSKNKVVCPKFK